MKMNVHSQFSQLRAVVVTPDDSTNFAPCGIQTKNDPKDPTTWRWLSPDANVNVDMELDGNDFPDKCNRMRKLVVSALIRLLAQVQYTKKPNDRYVAHYSMPYTSMEDEICRIVSTEVNDANDPKLTKLVELWSRHLWQSLLHLTYPLMTARNWDGSASAAGSGLLSLVSMLCMYGNLDLTQMTPENLAKWPIGIDVAGAPKGHPTNVNVEYMVCDEANIGPAVLDEIKDAIGSVFSRNVTRPTIAFTPDFVLSAGGAVLVTGDGKNSSSDTYDGESVMSLVSSRQFAYQDTTLGLTSSNYRFRLQEQRKGACPFSHPDGTEDIVLPTIEVKTYVSSRFDVGSQNAMPPATNRTSPTCSPKATTAWGKLDSHIADYITAVIETIDRLVYIMHQRLSLANLGTIRTSLQMSNSIVPMPYFVPQADLIVPKQEIWHIHSNIWQVWRDRNEIDAFGNPAPKHQPPGPPPPPPPPPPPGGAGGGSRGSSPPPGGAGGSSAGGSNVGGSQPPQPGADGGTSVTQRQSAPGMKESDQSSGLVGGSPAHKRIRLEMQDDFIANTQQDSDFSGQVTALLDLYRRENIGQDHLWEEEVVFYNAGTESQMVLSPRNVIMKAILHPRVDEEIRKVLKTVSEAVIGARLDIYNLFNAFLSEFVFDSEVYNQLVDFTMEYRLLVCEDDN